MISEKNILIDLHYLPCIHYVKTISGAAKLLIEQKENYQKMSYRNRCYIPGPNGVQLLSIPLVHGKNQHTKIDKVEIFDTLKWRNEHWKSLQFLYRSSPYFEYYEDEFSAFYLQPQHSLFEFNLNLMKWILKTLKINLDLQLTDSYQKPAPDSVLDLRNTILPNRKFEPDSLKPYFQQFENRIGFQPNMSIIDLIFMQGTNAGEFLK